MHTTLDAYFTLYGTQKSCNRHVAVERLVERVKMRGMYQRDIHVELRM